MEKLVQETVTISKLLYDSLIYNTYWLQQIRKTEGLWDVLIGRVPYNNDKT